MTSYNYRQWMFASLVCFVVDLEAASSYGDGVIVAFNTNVSLQMFCLRYFRDIFQLASREDAYAHSLRDLTPWSGCKAEPKYADYNQIDPIRGEVVVLDEHNCTVFEKAQVIQELGGSGLIIIDSKEILVNRSQHHHLNISVTIISNDSYQHIKALGHDVKVIQYATPTSSAVDFSLAIVWMMAMGCVILGSYWESIIQRLKTREMTLPACINEGEFNNQNRRNVEQDQQQTVQLTSALAVVVLVLCMCVMLLLIYFFYSYLVYFLIGMYSLGSATSLYQLFVSFLRLVPYGRMWIRKFLLFTMWMSLAITWFILRKESYSWMIQNFLSIGLLVNCLNVLRFPNFKICTIMLTLLFLYDIFFVFITPLFTKNGESVMVEAASGGDASGGEQMPMVFKVPNFNSYSICETRYLFLGFGDVLFPGLMVGYCFRFQFESGTKLYYYSSLISYGCGLLFTFLALFLMKSAQPALLYLMPTMLITSVVVALFRKEFLLFWTGVQAVSRDEIDDEDTETVSTDAEVPNWDVDVNDPPTGQPLNTREEEKSAY